MSTSDDDVKELVSLATIGEGLLRDEEEHRIMKVLLTAGFGAAEAKAKIDAALTALGVTRPGAAGIDAPTAIIKVPESRGASASLEDVTRAVKRSFTKKPTRRSLDPPSSVEVVAELVASSHETTKWSGVCSACLGIIEYEDVRSGRAEIQIDGKRHCRVCLSKLRAGLLCKSCYKPIERAELLDGRAQLHADRAVHAVCITQTPRKR